MLTNAHWGLIQTTQTLNVVTCYSTSIDLTVLWQLVSYLPLATLTGQCFGLFTFEERAHARGIVKLAVLSEMFLL